MSCGSNTIHVLLLLLLLQPLQRSKHRTPIRKTGRNRKIVIICGYKLAVAANEFEPVGGLCTLLAFHLIQHSVYNNKTKLFVNTHTIVL